MNYIGSKLSLLPFLESGIVSWIDGSCRTLFDVFAGTGIVGWHFKQAGFRIVANDIQYYAYCLNRARVQCNSVPQFSALRQVLRESRLGSGVEGVMAYLNALEGVEGFVYTNFCAGGTRRGPHRRMYFTDANGRKCDAIRSRIAGWQTKGLLDEREHDYLLASLVEAADRVANTASVYGAFLKRLKPSASRPLQLVPVPLARSRLRHSVHNEDGLELAPRVRCEVLYMDPPYNHRQYCSNYHVLETLARHDSPELRGVTGLRSCENQKSAFCSRRGALDALARMVESTPARYVFLSYNSEGIMHEDDILSLMRRHGRADLIRRPRARFRADVDHSGRSYRTDRVDEFLFRMARQ